MKITFKNFRDVKLSDSHCTACVHFWGPTNIKPSRKNTVIWLETNCCESFCVCLNRNFQLLSFGEEAEEDEREVTEAAQVWVPVYCCLPAFSRLLLLMY